MGGWAIVVVVVVVGDGTQMVCQVMMRRRGRSRRPRARDFRARNGNRWRRQTFGDVLLMVGWCGTWSSIGGPANTTATACSSDADAAVGLVELGRTRCTTATAAPGTGGTAGGMGVMMVVLLHQLVGRRGHILNEVIRRARGG